MCSGIDTRLKASPELHERQVAHHQIGVLITLSLLTCAGKDLVRVELHDFVLIVLKLEDGASDRGISADDNPVPSANSKHRVTHFINQIFLIKELTHTLT